MTDLNIHAIADRANEEIDALIQSDRAVELSHTDLGMDSRAGSCNMDIETSALFVPVSRANSFEYYSGFSYIDNDQKTTIGDWVVYHHPNCGNGNSRVSDAVDFYKEGQSWNVEGMIR